jgi:hypothetical protein
MSETKLKHLTHPEDRVFHGKHGFNHSFLALDSVHNSLLGKAGSTHKITTKYDGAPSIVAGHHPETGKFFVATKSAFNKNPKLNYTKADIAKNHESAGLREKLGAALTNLPKVLPKHGVFQGDTMYTKKDVQSDNKAYHFKPNTVTYSANKDSAHGKAISKAKLGVVFHTKYTGKTLADMAADFNVDHKVFKKHADVHMISPEIDASKSHYPSEAQDSYLHHMKTAMHHFGRITDGGHEVLAKHQAHIDTHINDAVKHNEAPSFEGFMKHIHGIHQNKMNELKTVSGRAKAKEAHNSTTLMLKAHEADLRNAFTAHHHMQAAKNVLVNALSTHTDLGHTINGKASKPEGFVASHNGVATKLVDRADFSRANLLSKKDWK